MKKSILTTLTLLILMALFAGWVNGLAYGRISYLTDDPNEPESEVCYLTDDPNEPELK